MTSQSPSTGSLRSPALPRGPWYPRPVNAIGAWTRSIPFLEKCRRQYGTRFTIRTLGIPPSVFIADPDEIRELFTADPKVVHAGDAGVALQPFVGARSLFVLDEEEHISQRRLLVGAFHGEKVDALGSLVTQTTARELDAWPSGTTALYPLLQKLTLEIMLRCAFGLHEGQRLDSLRQRLTELLAYGGRAWSVLWLLMAGNKPPIGFRRLHREVDELIFELIDERRDEHGETEGADLLAILMNATYEDGSRMSSQELRDELMTMLMAGHDPTATTLAWAFDRIRRSPAVLNRLVEDVLAGDDDSYITATIQETLRRRPALPHSAPRIAMEPVQIGDWVYPPGAYLFAATYLVHHESSIYPDPYAFRPERFLENPPGTYTWIPFGGGRRRCVGATFAMLEMRLVLREVLSRFSIAAVGMTFERSRRQITTLTPREGTTVMIGRRQTGVDALVSTAAP